MTKKKPSQTFSVWLEEMTSQAPSKVEMQEAMDQLKKELVQQQAEKAKAWLRDKYSQMQDRVERIRMIRRKAKSDIEALKNDLQTLEAQVEQLFKGEIEL